MPHIFAINARVISNVAYADPKVAWVGFLLGRLDPVADRVSLSMPPPAGGQGGLAPHRCAVGQDGRCELWQQCVRQVMAHAVDHQ